MTTCEHKDRLQMEDHSACSIEWCRDCGGLWRPGWSWVLPNNVEELIPVSGGEYVTPTEAVAMKYKAENEKLRAAAVAFSKLVTCYKIGRLPSEKLFKELEAARAVLEGK